MQQRFSTRNYSIRDFEEWHGRGDLELSPKFQQRDVWNTKARSYLIDTILRGKPIPKLYMRQLLNPKTRLTLREIVDGQQRLRSVLDYLKDGYKLLSIHNEEHGNKFFSDLDEEAQRTILNYELTVDLLQDMADEDIYEIFARLNTYSATLNAQELRHARHFGDFRTCVYGLSKEFIGFWQTNSIFTNKALLRMAEAEYVSDLLIAMTDGIRAKEKRILDNFYRDYDELFPNRKKLEKRFRETMDDIGGIMELALSESNLSSTRLFYSFFCAVYHMQYGLPKFEAVRQTFQSSDYTRLRNGLTKVDEIIYGAKEEAKTGGVKSMPADQRKFYNAYAEYWVHADKRRISTMYLCKLMLNALRD